MAVVSLWTPLAQSRIAERWFSLPNILLSVAGAGRHRRVAFWLWRWIDAQGATYCRSSRTIALFLLGYLGLVISNFPYLVPPTLTVWDTAAAPSSQIFMLIGTLLLLPIIIGYVVFVYWLFRGKVQGRRELSLSADDAAFASLPCGRRTAQPTRISGRRPCTGRAKARGSSGTISGNMRLELRRRRAGGVGRRPHQDAAIGAQIVRHWPTGCAPARYRDKAAAGSAR